MEAISGRKTIQEIASVHDVADHGQD